MENKVIEIFTDGGCRGNQTEKNIGSWGAYILFGSHEKRISGVALDTTKNIMELKAVIMALNTLTKYIIPVIITTDSNYVCQGMNEWIYTWMAKSWINSKRKPVKNKELWEELFLKKIKFDDIKFQWCKGHETIVGNIEADRLCNQAMDEYKPIS